MFPPLGTLVLAAIHGELLLLLLIVAAVMASALIRTLTGQTRPRGTVATPRRGTTPTPFSYWYALVPFEHGDGVKERPVLVLRVDGTTARVLRVTSQDKSGRTNWRRLDTSRWDRPGQRQGSWLQTDKTVAIPLSGFRRCLGHEGNVYFQRELLGIHQHLLGETEADESGEPQP